MQDIYFHLTIRLFTSFLIIYLLYFIRSNLYLDPRIARYWYLLATGQISFLFFPFIKNSSFSFPFVILFKTLFSSFCFFLWLSSKLFLDRTFQANYKHWTLLALIEFFSISFTRIEDKFIFINGNESVKWIGYIFFVCTISLQSVFCILAIVNTYSSYKIEADDILIFIKQFFLISAGTSAAITILIIITNQHEISEIRIWFVSLFHLSIICIAFLLLKIRIIHSNTRNTKEIIISSPIENPKLNFQNLEPIQLFSDIKQSLDILIYEEKIFLLDNCSLKAIAQKSNLPEYKIRKFIKNELGFQNFNQFLNHHRIIEAATLLHSNKELPISRIAYMVGYSSIATFNRAFRKVKKISPSEYKRKYSTI